MIGDDLAAFLNTLGNDDLRSIMEKIECGRGGETLACPGGTAGTKSRGKAPCPAKTFDVPQGVKHLDQIQLFELTESFHGWYASAPSPARKKARGRIWLLYLLVRHGALKLGEALAVDDREDFDFARSVIIVRGDHQREIPLPKEVSQEIERLLNDPMNASLRGSVLKLDQGFVRRKFYERAAECAIPKELINPRVLRHSRAIELLREGLPIAVVQSFLGHQSAGLTAQYVNFSAEDIRRLIDYFILKESRMKTSARNSFSGKVTAVLTGDIQSQVEVTTPSGLRVVSVITNDSMRSLGIREGALVTATVKAPWVILVKGDGELNTSARNRYRGKVVTVTEGRISAEVIVALPDGTRICSLVTDESVRNLALKEGETVSALFEAFSVILNAD